MFFVGIKGQEQKGVPHNSDLWPDYLLSLRTVEKKLSGEAEGTWNIFCLEIGKGQVIQSIF